MDSRIASPTSPVAELIRLEISAAGPLSFARFMELALYAPGLGYYERNPEAVGRSGDFYTSASVGSLFGELLAFEFAAWFTATRLPAGQLVEAGAHDGRLAADILRWLTARPSLPRLDYWILEPSAVRQDWQRRRLAEFSGRVSWARHLAEVPPAPGRIVFGNELLDAMPVRRFGWDAPAVNWFEWGVDWRDGRFAWTRLRAEAPVSVPPELLSVLPDGYTVEVCPAATAWWRDAATRLQRGWLVGIDYGFTAEERFQPARRQGTLRSYRQHRLTTDPLADPGEQDLTAHVDFGALQAAGEAAGLATRTLTTQARFLTSIAARAWENPESFGQWTPARTRQFQTLTHPDHLGRSFRVLVQENLPCS